MARTSKAQEEKWALEVKGRIEYYRTVRETTHPKIASGAGISRTTYYSRLANPADFTVGEIGRIASYLNVSSKVLMYGIEPQKGVI